MFRVYFKVFAGFGAFFENFGDFRAICSHQSCDAENCKSDLTIEDGIGQHSWRSSDITQIILRIIFTLSNKRFSFSN